MVLVPTESTSSHGGPPFDKHVALSMNTERVSELNGQEWRGAQSGGEGASVGSIVDRPPESYAQGAEKDIAEPPDFESSLPGQTTTMVKA
jgi:hypothetical protein